MSEILGFVTKLDLIIMINIMQKPKSEMCGDSDLHDLIVGFVCVWFLSNFLYIMLVV